MIIKRLLVIIGLAFFAGRLHAQLPIDGAHYPVGLDGIKNAAAPTPGFYFRDDNLFYYGTADVLPDYTTHVYLQAPRLGWTSEWKILGATYGMDVMVPVIYKKVSYDQQGIPIRYNHDSDKFGIGDILFQPVLLHWSFKQLDLLSGAGIWMPTGRYDSESLVNLGDGKWSPMITLGGVWYPDTEKFWAISVLNHYEFNCQTHCSRYKIVFAQPGPPMITTAYESTPNSTYTLECGISRIFLKDFDAGISGYYQKQFTDQGNASVLFANSEVIGIGPEISAKIDRWNLAVTLHYAHEFYAFNRPQGDMVSFSIIKRF